MPDAIDITEDDAFDALLDRLPEDQLSDAFKTLRDQNRNLKKEVRELKPYRQVAVEAERNAAFSAAGLTDLTEQKRTALLAVAGEKQDADGIRAAAVALGWIAVDPASTPEAVAAADAAIAAHSQSSPGHVPPLPTLTEQIKQAEAARDWLTASRLKLQLLKAPSTGGAFGPA